MIDLLIRGGVVVDGTGGPGRRADVAIQAGTIVRVDADAAATAARRVLRADGLVVAPGFIDMHSHADFTLPSYPEAINSLGQGVTSEVIGNCGFSPAPLASSNEFANEQRAACRGFGPNLAWNWRSFGEYLDRLDAARPAVNCIPLVGQGTLRLATMGPEDRPASPLEIDQMGSAAAAALSAGAWGLSTGLEYAPGAFSSTNEIIAVAQALPAMGGIYASHIRSEGEGIIDALTEALQVGARLGVHVQVSHLKAAGRANHGRIGEVIALLDAARAAGVKIAHDAYPYTSGSTLLSQLLPPWVRQGGIEELLMRLKSDAVRSRIATDLERGLPGWSNYFDDAGGWDHIRIAAVADPTLRGREGATISAGARKLGSEPLAFVLDTLAADRAATTMILSLLDQADVAAVIRHPATAIGSDQLGVVSRTANVHPRAYGTFARILGHYVRELGVLDLPDAIHRMTGLPAAILGLGDRGHIAVGKVADLVVFDPEHVADQATYEDPTQIPSGVEAVVIGGRLALLSGMPTNMRHGRVLRRTGYRGGIGPANGRR